MARISRVVLKDVSIDSVLVFFDGRRSGTSLPLLLRGGVSASAIIVKTLTTQNNSCSVRSRDRGVEYWEFFLVRHKIVTMHALIM